MEFKDISMEAQRVYVYQDGDKVTERVVEDLKALAVSESGTHRVVTGAGLRILPAAKRVDIKITLKPGQPVQFSF